MNLGKIGRVAFLIGVGLVSGVGLTILSMDESGWWQKDSRTEPGTSLFEADPAEVRLLTFSTDTMMLTAQRSKPGVRLAIQVTYTDDRPPLHCISSPDLDGVLSSLAVTKVKKRVNRKEIKTNYPIKLGYLEFQDEVIGEPIEPWTLFTTHDRSVIVVDQPSVTFETDISPTIIKRLESGCQEG